MTAVERTRHRLTRILLVSSAVVVVAAAAVSFAGVSALRNYEGARNVDVEFVAIPPTKVGMIAGTDSTGRLASLAVVVLAPASAGEVGGSVVVVPVAADTSYGGDTRVPLDDVFVDGGESALVLAVESLLSITIDVSMVADRADFAAIFGVLQSVQVDLPAEVSVEGTDGERTVLFEAGRRELTPVEAAEVLTARDDGQPERVRRANAEAVWRGVSAAVGNGIGPLSATSPTMTVMDVMRRIVAGSLATRMLVTLAVPADENPSGRDVEYLDIADAVLVFASIAPNSTSAVADGLTYRIEAPRGSEQRVREVVGLLLYVGENVQSIYLSDEYVPAPETVFELYSPQFAGRAEVVAGVLAPYVIETEPAYRIAGVDVVIRLGAQFLSGGELVPPATTAPPADT